mgnify:CR=1 FL=1
MWSRREFLVRSGAVCGSAIGLGSAAPQWWQRVALAAEKATSGRKLVVIELRGGNDGLNTVVPFADDRYHKARPTLGIKAEDAIKLDDHLGLHPEMTAWKPLWEDGKLAIVENCGYPNPNRSHFESMDIWHAGQIGTAATSGWLGRAADRGEAGELCYVGDGAASLALSRRLGTVAALERLTDLRLDEGVPPLRLTSGPGEEDLALAIAKRMRDVRKLSDRLPQPQSEPDPTTVSTNEVLNARLEIVRTLIERDEPFRVYYTALPGFDTHAQQSGTHGRLWRQTATAVSEFLASLKKAKLDDDVTVFLFSEFGRRVHENGSAGTDHGAAAPVFVLGNRVAGGIQGGVPNLADLDNGDLRHQVDFRDVYAALLGDWLGVDPSVVLDRDRSTLKLFA